MTRFVRFIPIVVWAALALLCLALSVRYLQDRRWGWGLSLWVGAAFYGYLAVTVNRSLRR